MVGLLKTLETPYVSQLALSESTQYDSTESFYELLQAMSDVIEAKVKEDIATSDVITVKVDESTDRANKKRFAILVRTISSSMDPITHYLANIQVPDGTGETMAIAIKEELKKFGVTDLKKVYGLGTDCATAMTGSTKGVTGLLKRENPMLVNVHCAAHRLALCTSQAAEDIPALKDYVDTLSNLFYYFKASLSRCARLEEIQAILDSDKLRFKEIHQIRWLSFYEALQTVFRNLLPLLTYLENCEAASRAQDPKAIGLKRKIATVKFIGVTAILMDVIPFIGALNLFLQQTEVDIGAIKTKIDDCLRGIAELKCGGKHFQDFQTQLETNVDGRTTYHNHVIASCPQTDITSAASKFVTNLQANISKRFPDTELLSAFGVLKMRPITMVSDDEIEEWGNDRFNVLLQHYGKKQTHKWKGPEGENKVSESEPLIDSEAAKDEWKDLKKLVKREGYPRHTTVQLYKQIAEYHADTTLKLLKLAKCAITLPVHTVDVERSFSTQNLLCTPLRNALTPEHQDLIIRVVLEGPKVVEAKANSEKKEKEEAAKSRLAMDKWVVAVIDRWSATKNRRLFQKGHSSTSTGPK